MVHATVLSGRWGFVLKEDQLDPDYKSVMRAGGEILERYNVRRGAASTDEIKNLDRDFSGNIIVEK